MVDVESGLLLAAPENITIAKESLPESAALLPDNFNKAGLAWAELSELEKKSDEFAVHLWTPRGEGGIYHKGEELKVYFKSTRDCYLKLYHIDAQGNRQLIFPNRFYAHNSICAEFIHADASLTPFTDIETDFQNLSGSLSKGLSVELKQGEKAAVVRKSLSYTIVE